MQSEPVADGRGQVKIRLVRYVQLRISRVLCYTNNLSGAIIYPEVFADGVFARPMSARQGFVDNDDRGFAAGFPFAESAAVQQRDAQRGEVIRRDDVVCGGNP